MATKRLVRLPAQGQLAGVCAGLAEYFDLDVSIIRVAFALGAIFTGGALVVGYILLAIVMPVASHSGPESALDIQANVEELKREFQQPQRGDRAKHFVGVWLVLLGIWLLIGQWFPHWWEFFNWEYVLPIALIAIGIYIVVRRSK